VALYVESAALNAELTLLRAKSPESLTDTEKSIRARLEARSVCLEKEILAQKVFVSALLLKLQAPKS
jgi:hypothetical protein